MLDNFTAFSIDLPVLCIVEFGDDGNVISHEYWDTKKTDKWDSSEDVKQEIYCIVALVKNEWYIQYDALVMVDSSHNYGKFKYETSGGILWIKVDT